MAKKLNLRRAKQFRPLSVTPGVGLPASYARTNTRRRREPRRRAQGQMCSSQWGNQGGQRGQLTPPNYLEGPALALEGPLWLFEGPALPFEGPALALEGLALALEGPALALEGLTLALEGLALALQGPIWP